MTVQALLDGLGLGGVAASLGPYLVRQRWFGGQGQSLESVSVEDAGVLDRGDPTLVLLLARARYADGSEEIYELPLALRPAGGSGGPDAEGLVATGASPTGAVEIRDALTDRAAVAALWRAIAGGGRLPTCHGEVELRASATAGLAARAEQIQPIRGEQSNSALVWKDREFLKFIRRLQDGPSIELEMAEALEAGGFEQMAPILASALYRRRGGGAAAPVAIVQRFLAGGTDGWRLALESLRPAGEAGAPELTFRDEAERLGEVTARMHLALGSTRLRGPLQPLPVDRSMLSGWSAEMLDQLDRVCALPGDATAQLRALQPAIAVAFRALPSLADEGPGWAIRVHGDYHLGQVMRRRGDWTVLDFEGEPGRSPEARRQRSSPLRDVAGMLRSFDYVAASALAERLSPDDPGWAEAIRPGRAWARACGEAFWHAYSRSLAASRLLPSQPGVTLRLLRTLELDKAVYEVGYELGHRPTWVAIPLDFLTRYTIEPPSR